MDNKLYRTSFILIVIPSIACLISIILRIVFGDIEKLGDAPLDTLVALLFSITNFVVLLGVMSAALGLVLAIISKVLFKVQIKWAIIIGCAFFLVLGPYMWVF